MKINGIMLNKIDINLIVPIYTESVSEAAVQKRVKLLRVGEELPNYPVVERDNQEEKYWLVSGFLEYTAYKLFADSRKQILCIPVIEQEYSNITTQRIKLLRKMFQDPSNWLDRHYLLNNLIDEDVSIKDIAKKIGVSFADINNYLINPELPEEIVEKAYKNKGSFRNLDQIRRLNLHIFLKDRLYHRAVSPIRDYNRLTTDKLQKILWLLTLKDFRMLHWQEQWELIEQAVTFKDILLRKWEEDCTKKLVKKGQMIYVKYDSSVNHSQVN
ncbi:hypothetical protein B9K06_12620 [Bacillus sp. OG2]|nr:hypothetical protein B9K06_12620 [Bacillus sp. OG2]